MSNFRTKVLGMAAMATAFVGLSYGQTISCAAGTAETVVQTAPSSGVYTAINNPTLRAEGSTELVSDAQVSGCTSTLATIGSVYATLNLPVTSKSITATGFTGNSEALLQVLTAPGVQAAGSPYFGTVTGTSVAFTNVSFPVAFTLQLSNIRVNAAGAASSQVTETVDIQYGAPSANLNPASLATAGPGVVTGVFQVGLILPSLAATNLAGTAPFQFTNYTVCAGNPVPLGGTGTPTASFTVNIKELVGSAFKTQAQEGGSYVPAVNPNNIGVATTGDQVLLTLGNVPAQATVYVPLTITQGGTTLTANNATAVTTPTGVAGLAAFTAVSGVVTIPYTVTVGGAAAGVTTFPVPVDVIFASNSVAAQGAITVLTSYAPAAAVTGPAAAIPTFAVSTATPLNVSAIAICSTTLLFPYVTNATGFETGIAIANTTTDNLKTIPAPGSAATPTNGTCTLNFYGNAAQPTATVTPTIGAYSSTAPTVVPIFANILTSMVGSSGFSGYAIASCNFQEAHGFAFITDTTGTFSGTEGYLAVVIPATRGENTTEASTASVSLSSFTLSLNAVTGAITGTASGSSSGTISGATGQ